MDSQRKPKTRRGRELREAVSPERWQREIDAALGRAQRYDGIVAAHDAGDVSWHAAVRAAGVHWSTFRKWQYRCAGSAGETWERLLDERVPPSTAVPDTIRAAACTLRQVDPAMNTERARTHLRAQFGDLGALSDATLRRIWAAAGLSHRSGPGSRSGLAAAAKPAEQEEVEQFYGGAGLALVAAADAETGTSLHMAEAAQKADTAPEGTPQDDSEDRDEHGRFTAEYNARWREGVAPGEVDERWTTDARKASRRDLSKLRTREVSVENLAGKLLVMGMTPLVTERRGFDGLDGPTGAWLGVTGALAYMPATLDKTLAELGLLAVEEALWDTHARHWAELTRKWSTPGPAWLQTIAYVDGTADPYWTQAFAQSGKVSRVGRVMPCISRVALNSGAGVPLLVETHAGAAPLKRSLGPMLDRLARAVGPKAAADRMTVVDSEAGKAGVLWALHTQAEVFFISVVKGASLENANLQQVAPWQPFRERDQLCESTLRLHGKDGPAGGLPLRAVQMRRPDSRQPQATVFVTNAAVEDLAAGDVASVYLERWPRQEQMFRNGRNGAGLNRSHGYGREQVTHVALAEKVAAADARVIRAEAALKKASLGRNELAAALAEARPQDRQRALALADANVKRATRAHSTAQTAAQRIHTMPNTIQKRDTGRDGVMTCAKLMAMLLVEFVLKEYFGGLAMEWRTFIDQFVPLPVTARTTKQRRLFQIHTNPRQPERMAQLGAALTEINRRQIRQGKRLLVFELLDGGAGSGP